MLLESPCRRPGPARKQPLPEGFRRSDCARTAQGAETLLEARLRTRKPRGRAELPLAGRARLGASQDCGRASPGTHESWGKPEGLRRPPCSQSRKKSGRKINIQNLRGSFIPFFSMFFLKVSIQCLVLYVASACLAAGEAGASLLKGALIGDAQPAVMRGGLKRAL